VPHVHKPTRLPCQRSHMALEIDLTNVSFHSPHHGPGFDDFFPKNHSRRIHQARGVAISMMALTFFSPDRPVPFETGPPISRSPPVTRHRSVPYSQGLDNTDGIASNPSSKTVRSPLHCPPATERQLLVRPQDRYASLPSLCFIFPHHSFRSHFVL